MIERMGDLPERFRSKFRVAENGCWEWTATTSRGYGRYSFGTRMVRAHRYAYEVLVRPIPEGLHIDHLCRNRACVNPEHLEPVTHVENVRRSPFTIASISAAATHCPQGHPYLGRNLILRRGWRECRACENERQRYRSRKSAQIDGSGADGES